MGAMLHTLPKRRLLALTFVACMLSFGPLSASAASKVTLGSAKFARQVPQFNGAGKVRPDLAGDGNTCEGLVSALKWKRWGSKRATATGAMCNPCDVSCRVPSPAQAVAYDLGRCTSGGPRVYRRFKARVQRADGTWSKYSSLNTFGAGGKLCRMG